MKISFEEGLEMLGQHLTSPNILVHSKEVAAIMAHLAKRLGKDEENWRLAGLLHDLDYDMEKENMENHAKTAVEILRRKGFREEELLHAILAHNEDNTGVKRESDMDYALSACDNMAGLVHATALIYPDKKISSVKPSSVTKRFKSPSFAAGARRDQIIGCEKIGLSLDEFAQVSVEAVTSIAEEVGL